MYYRRRHCTNLVIFAVALSLVLYLNLAGSNPGSSDRKSFAWTTVRYRTISSDLPSPGRGVCPGLKNGEKPALVVSRVDADGDPGWLSFLERKYHLCVYNADEAGREGSKHLQLPANRGHESMAYLTFLIDNYHDIPAAGVVFVHGSRFSWHNDAPDYDNAYLLNALKIPAALGVAGYHNMRCDWSASTCDVSYAPPQGSFETTFNAYFSPWDARAKSDAAIATALSSLFGGSGSIKALEELVVGGIGGRLRPGRGDAIRSQCCAQFVVARENIWQHTREEYVAIRQWLLDTKIDPGNIDVAPQDDRIAGRILSYMWHILFLPRNASGIDLNSLNQMACPRAGDCYCRLYGRCGLEGCVEPGHCFGQYSIPPDFTLPLDWAERHAKAQASSSNVLLP